MGSHEDIQARAAKLKAMTEAVKGVDTAANNAGRAPVDQIRNQRNSPGLRQAIRNATGIDSNGLSPEDHASAQGQIQEVIREETRIAAQKLVKEFGDSAFLDHTRQQIMQAATQGDAAQVGADPAAISDQIEDLEAQYLDALEKGELASIVDVNPIAKAAMTKSMQDMQLNVQRRLAEIKLIKPTPKIGRLADMRNAPITSLLEYVRFVPELGIAFIAGNSAKNMMAELLGQNESTTQLSYDNRLVVASAAGIVMSYMAYQLRHSLYKDAQEHGHKYARLPVPPVTATISAYKNVLRKTPIRTSLRTGMALGVALAGGNVLLNLAGASGKSVEFGKTTINVMDPLNEKIVAAGTVMDSFLKQVEERCKAIVAAEVDPKLAGEGTGKGVRASYGSKAAAKDYLCFGKTEGGRQPPQGLVTFRESIGLQPGVSIAAHYKALWNERESSRQELFTRITEKLKALQTLVQTEADIPFAIRVEQATLKNIPENKIPGAKAELIAAIDAYIKEINEYSAKVDGISHRIATEGLSAANAAGQNIEIKAPKITIDITDINALPTSPVGKTGFFLTPALAVGAKDTLSRVPGINFITPLLSNNQEILAFQLMTLGLLVYLGAENVPNAFFVNRERMRSRRLKREMEPKQRDYYLMLDKLAENIADMVIEVIAPYKQMMARENDAFQSREQLISAIKFAIVSADPEETPDGSEHPLRDWSNDRMSSMSHYLKHLYDWGPEDAVELDQAIGRVSRIMRKIEKGSPQQVAKVLMELGVPGADIFGKLFDSETSGSPEKFAEAIKQSDLKAMQHSVRYLVLKMQARQFVIDRIASRIESDRSGRLDRNHSEQVRDSLSGVILSLDGSGSKLAVSADEVRYYRVWAELAAEQEQDQKDLLRVAVAGRTYWDRRFKVDQGLGTVDIPEEFRSEFIASATSNPVGEAALLVESYQQMLERMLSQQGDVSGLTDILDRLNSNAVPELRQSLEDEKRLNDNYSVNFACVFSTKHGGPVIRCDLFEADTGVAAATIEAPFIVGDGSQTSQEFNDRVAAWFSENSEGRREIIARAKHFELAQFMLNKLFNGPKNDELVDGTLQLTENTAPETLRAAQREMMYRTIYDRQGIRLNSLLQQSLQDGEMPLFELPKELYDATLAPQDISRLSGINIDGMLQLNLLLPRLKNLPEGVHVSLDIPRRLIFVTKEPERGGILSRRRGQLQVMPYELNSLNQLDRLEAAIRLPR